MSAPRRLLCAALAAASLGFAVAAPGDRAGATALALRTFRLSVGPDGADANGGSTRPSLSADGQLAVFDSTASTLAPDANGAVRDVFARDIRGQTTRIVSLAPGGGAADGPSSQPSVGGPTIAFVSAADNLVPGDTNGRRDIFAENGGQGPLLRVSVATDGTQADGDSREPEVSADGRYVVFTSDATNLVPDDINGKEDVFLRDLVTQTTYRISDIGGVSPNGASYAPSVSADGRYVSFASDASDLVAEDTNRTTDIFVVDRSAGSVERVSVSSEGFQQDKSVIPPFEQTSSISANGRYVAFDSDGTDLVPGDTNRDTDVFVRDRAQNTTTRVSVTSTGRQGDNDSFYPRITGNGRDVIFESFAGDLAPRGAPREDVFVHDRTTGGTALVDATSANGPRGPEHVPELLQRPAISADGSLAAFTSTSGQVTPGDHNLAEDVFVRILIPPHARFTRLPPALTTARRVAFGVHVDDRAGDRLLCTLDARRFPCGPHGGVTPRLHPGTHVLRVRAGGIGMLFETYGSTARLRVR